MNALDFYFDNVAVHRVVVLFSKEIFAQIITTGWAVPSGGQRSVECVSGIPEDARYIHGFYDSERDLFGMIFEHESFPETIEGNTLPVIKPVFKVGYYERESLM